MEKFRDKYFPISNFGASEWKLYFFRFCEINYLKFKLNFKKDIRWNVYNEELFGIVPPRFFSPLCLIINRQFPTSDKITFVNCIQQIR